jgi:hypothetical protein
MDALLNFDIEIFRYVNTGLTAPFLDTVMVFMIER